MKTRKLLAVLFLSGATLFTSCKKDEDSDPTPSVGGDISVFENITTNTTWTTGNVYVLRNRISVEAGATLTIEPGVIVKGEQGQEAASKALIIARDAKINAVGTAAEPIIFTSVDDQIRPGEVQSSLEIVDKGLWGGLIICGNARISASGDVTELQIEGIPTTDQNGLYGGMDDTDNSGTLKYVSIRHGGTLIGDGNEINGLTLAGVGSGTTIENIEIVANLDDGIEWFGGTVNVTNALVWAVGDDGMDTDQSWSGTCDNFVVVAPEGHCFELDGPEGNYAAPAHTFKNGTVIASDDGVTARDLVNVDANSLVALENVHITGVKSGQKIREDKDADISTVSGVSFTDVTVDVPTGSSLADHVGGTIPSGITAGNTPKADLSVFAGWTAADAAGKLQ